MLLRKDALMKVDKQWKNMSARLDVVPGCNGGGEGWRGSDKLEGMMPR